MSTELYEPSFSDDLEALHAQEVETRAEHKRLGTVIQHRSWPLTDVFRSDDDRSQYIPSSQPVRKQPIEPPSSPPVMPYMSSAVSTALPAQPPKRKFPSDPTTNVFMEESDDDEDDASPQDQRATPKRIRTQEEVSPGQEVEDVQETSHRAQATQSQTSQSQDLGLSLLAKRLVSNPLIASKNTPASTQLSIRTSAGKSFAIRQKAAADTVSYERLIASRSEAVQGRAQRSHYGIDIQNLVKEAKAQQIIDAAEAEKRNILPSTERHPPPAPGQRAQKTLMWTEKYRARKFTELVGDDRTHRYVMHWLKRWDDIVFPGSARPKSKHRKNAENAAEERPHRKILLLTGPPGLGKTTLAHVCARQAGYEVQEINASDERSSNVVKGRIRDMAGTENVRGVDTKTATGKVRKAGRPVCVVVDEVDGVVGGSGGGGEGGFIKALIDLVNLDSRNSNNSTSQQFAGKKKKGDNFRLLRPLILICNDVYHPSLRPLRQSTIAEIIHVRKPAINTVVTRMQSIFDKENVPFDGDGVRKLCEAAWGMTSRKEGGTGSSTGEGDIRGILVVAEWIAGRLRATHDPIANSIQRLTRRWVEANVMADLAQGGGSARGMGRGGPREVVDRVFKEGAGFSKPSTLAAPTSNASISGVKGVAEAAKQQSMYRLREMIETSGDIDRIMTDCFSAYPEHPYQDDNYLSKPSEAYDWLYFHDRLSSAVFSSNEWELAPYLSNSILAFHELFATPTSARFSKPTNWNEETGKEEAQEPAPFSGPQASFHAHEARKSNLACLQALQSGLSLPLIRMFSAPEAVATDLVPYIVRMVSPSINPVIVHNSGSSTASVRKASEKLLVNRAVNAMLASGLRFEKARLDTETGIFSSGPAQWIYRMEPGLDDLAGFETLDAKAAGIAVAERTRFAVRQVLEQEFLRESKRAAETTRLNRNTAVVPADADAVAGADVGLVPQPPKAKLKRDFFGRIVVEEEGGVGGDGGEEGEGGEGIEGRQKRKKNKVVVEESNRVWVTFHEGFSNAVRKPISLRELLGGV